MENDGEYLKTKKGKNLEKNIGNLKLNLLEIEKFIGKKSASRA